MNIKVIQTLPVSNTINLKFLTCVTYIPVYTGKLCHCGKCHSGNCHSGKRWMSRPFVHSGNWNVKHTLSNVLVFHNAWKRIICHFITWRRYMLLTEPFRNVVYAFIWLSFATVYEWPAHPPLPTMAVATMAIATIFLSGIISLCISCTNIAITCYQLPLILNVFKTNSDNHEYNTRQASDFQYPNNKFELKGVKT